MSDPVLQCLILQNVCHVSSVICVLQQSCNRAATNASYYCICVLCPLYMCPHACIYVSCANVPECESAC
jgi:hypothetical protein